MDKQATIAGILDLAREELETQRAVYAKNGPADELAEADNALEAIEDIQPLLLAAPELLAALVDLVSIATERDTVPSFDGAWKRARAAIAKAEANG